MALSSSALHFSPFPTITSTQRHLLPTLKGSSFVFRNGYFGAKRHGSIIVYAKAKAPSFYPTTSTNPAEEEEEEEEDGKDNGGLKGLRDGSKPLSKRAFKPDYSF
uniref:Uncharacterized protein MANES_08G151200 n=1 Tax=Rhizophora mucronata TaxID=61149 RepID=A0A2P2KNE5_RHIMU